LFKQLIILLLLAGLSCAGISQESRQYSFTHFSSINGLAANHVNNIVQDDRGYIWIATINGLQRFDGNNFLTFNHDSENPKSIPAENVVAVYKDKKGRLWLSTIDNKVGLFDTEKFTYQEIKVKWQGTPTYYFQKGLSEMIDGTLIIITLDYGIYVWNEQAREFELKPGYIPTPPGWRKNNFAEDSARQLILVACDSGMAVYNKRTGHLNYRGNNIDHDSLVTKVEKEMNFYNVLVDRKGRYFFNSWPTNRAGPRFIFYNPANGGFGDYYIGDYMAIGYFEIGGAFSQSNGHLWVYGASFLTQFIEGGTRPFVQVQNEYKDEQSIKFDRLHSIFEDNQHNLWLCSDNGVFLFNPEAQFFNAYRLLHVGENRSIDLSAVSALHMKNNQIWVSSWGEGVYYFDENLNALPIPKYMEKYRTAWSIWCMTQDKINDDVWMGVQGGTILRCNPVKETSETASPAILDHRTVRHIVEDDQGNMWIGTQNGMVLKWDRKAAGNDISKGYTKIIQTGMVMKMVVDQKGFLWVACMAFGVYKIDTRTGKIVDRFYKLAADGKTLFTDSPHDLFIYNDSMMMVPGDAINLINMRTNKVEFITTKEGLPSNTARSVQRDARGNFWIGMLNGMVRMNLEKRIFTYYDRRDGIVFDNFTSASAFKLPDGRLLFTTDHNFLAFDPTRVVTNNVPNDVQITDFRLANKPLLVDSLVKLDAIKLGYDNSSIMIEFNDLNFIRQNKIQYYYMLVGIDKEWVIAEDNHQAVYTWLPPGDYVFKVNCQNGDGIWSKSVTTLNIHVSSPFWKTWWFYGFLVLLAAAILYGIDRERVKRMRSMQQMRSQIAGNLHQEINTTLNSINLLSEMAKMKADKDLDRSKEYIDQIGEKSQNMMIAMDDILWSIQPENDSMDKTILRIEEFADALRNRYGTDIELQVDKKARSIELDMKTRHEFFLIFKEALRTFVQHAGARQVLIYLDHSGTKLALKIQAPETVLESTNLQVEKGITEMEKRASLIGALLDIQSDARTSNIILLLPVE